MCVYVKRRRMSGLNKRDISSGDHRRALPPVSACGQTTCAPCSQSCSSWGSREDGLHRCEWSSAWSYNISRFHSRKQHTCQRGLQKMCTETGGWKKRQVSLSAMMHVREHNRLCCCSELGRSFTPCRWRCAVMWRPAWGPSLIGWSVGSRGGLQTPSSLVDCGRGQSTAGSAEGIRTKTGSNTRKKQDEALISPNKKFTTAYSKRGMMWFVHLPWIPWWRYLVYPGRSDTLL